MLNFQDPKSLVNQKTTRTQTTCVSERVSFQYKKDYLKFREFTNLPKYSPKKKTKKPYHLRHILKNGVICQS